MNPLQRKVALLERAADALEAERERAEAQRVAALTPEQRRVEADARLGQGLGLASGLAPWSPAAVEFYRDAVSPPDRKDVSWRGLTLRFFVPTPEALEAGAAVSETERGAWLFGYATAVWPRIVGSWAHTAALVDRKDAKDGKPIAGDPPLTERRSLELVAGATDGARARLLSLLRIRCLSHSRKWRAWVRALVDLLEAYRAEVGALLASAPADPTARPDPERIKRLWTWAPDHFGELRYRLENPGEAYRMEPDALGRLMPFPVGFLDGRAERVRAAKAGA